MSQADQAISAVLMSWRMANPFVSISTLAQDWFHFRLSRSVNGHEFRLRVGLRLRADHLSVTAPFFPFRRSGPGRNLSCFIARRRKDTLLIHVQHDDRLGGLNSVSSRSDKNGAKTL